MRTLLLSFASLIALVALPACGGTNSNDPDATGGVSGSGGGPTSGGTASAGGAAARDLPFAVSGQRLEAWFLTLEGGGADTSLFSTFHDSLLDTPCSFIPSVSGLHVCAPSAQVEVVYLDDACSQPAAQVDPYQDAPPLWVNGYSDHFARMPSQLLFFRRGEQLFVGGVDALTTELPEVFVRSGSRCDRGDARSGHVPSNLYRLEVVPESTFVAGRTTAQRVASEFSVERLVADDGAQVTLAVLDRGGQPCEVQPDGVCVPTPYVEWQYYSEGLGTYLDAGCTEPSFVPSDRGFTPKVALTRNHRASQVYDLTTVTTPTFSKTYLLDAAQNVVVDPEGHIQYTCQPSNVSGALTLGTEVTSQLASAARTEIPVNGLRWTQLRAPSPANGVGAFVPFEAGAAFLDDQGLGCRAFARVDGDEFECTAIVNDAFGADRWSDANCTRLLYRFTPPSDASTTDEAISTLRVVERSLAGEFKLRSLKAYSGPTYHLSGATECEPAESTPPLLEVDREWSLPHFTRVRR